MTDLRQAAQQALEFLEGGSFVYPTQLATALREALAQPVQEPVTCRFCHDARGCWTWQCYSCGEIDDVQKPAAQPEPVSMRMPKVGDRVICLEDESIGEVVSLTAGGSPDIAFDDGSRGTYMLREFAELFGYVTPPQRPWQGLTDEDWGWVADRRGTSLDTFDQGAAWAQARLKERNK